MKEFQEIYWLKAIAIAAVVLTHAVTYREIFPSPGSVAEFLSQFAHFAVPIFFFASGFLFDKSVAPTGELAHKILLRIGLPYLTASLLVLTMRSQVDWLDGRFVPDWPTLLRALFFGEALGIYYYVFVIAYLYILAMLLRRLPRSAIYALFGASLLLLIDFIRQGVTFPAVAPEKFLWFVLRHPAVHLPPFIAGWLFSLHYPVIRPWLARHSKPILLVGVSVDVLLLSSISDRHGFTAQQLLQQLHTFVMLFIVLAVGLQIRQPPRLVRFLADASYSIFLFHLIFVRATQELLVAIEMPVALRIGMVWFIGLGLTSLLVLSLQRLPGVHSRRWFGA